MGNLAIESMTDWGQHVPVFAALSQLPPISSLRLSHLLVPLSSLAILHVVNNGSTELVSSTVEATRSGNSHSPKQAGPFTAGKCIPIALFRELANVMNGRRAIVGQSMCCRGIDPVQCGGCQCYCPAVSSCHASCR